MRELIGYGMLSRDLCSGLSINRVRSLNDWNICQGVVRGGDWGLGGACSASVPTVGETKRCRWRVVCVFEDRKRT